MALYSRFAKRLLCLCAALAVTLPTVFAARGADKMDRPISEISYDLTVQELDRYFADPPNIYRIIQYMNQPLAEPLSEKGAGDLVRELQDYGIGGVQVSVSWFDNYLESNKAWKDFLKNVRLARDMGMRISIHDETGYPSGMAGGKVVLELPDKQAKGVFCITKQGNGTGEQSLALPGGYTYISARLYPLEDGRAVAEGSREQAIAGTKAVTQGMEGDWTLAVFGVAVMDRATQAQQTMAQFKHPGKYPSYISPESGAKLVELTYDAYAKRMPDIGKTVDYFYSGEPHLMTVHWPAGDPGRFAFLPWESELAEKFRQMHGYDLMPVLYFLYAGQDDTAKTVRIHYYQTISRLFTENYPEAINGWCRAHGVKFFFHPLLEETLPIHVACYGDMMAALCAASMPSCDIPVPQLNWGPAKWEFWMTKLPGSAAILGGKSEAGALIDPIIGGNGRGDLAPGVDRMLRAINMSYFNGVNRFSTYVRYKEYAKEDYRLINEYTGRLGVMLRGAQNDASIAMYYPIETFQATVLPTNQRWPYIRENYGGPQKTLDSLATKIILGGSDFNYITPDAILGGKIEKGRLVIGPNRYRAVLMPCVQVIPLAVLQKLQECSREGVDVRWIDDKPALGTRMDEHGLVKKIAAGLKTEGIEAADGIIAAGSDDRLRIEPLGEPLSVGRYLRTGKRTVFIMNDGGQPRGCRIESRSAQSVKIYDPEYGTVETAALPHELKVAGYRGVVVMENE